jgi:hypothetical protein
MPKLAACEPLTTSKSDWTALSKTIFLATKCNYLAQSDKSWDAMHRTLADGELTWDGGAYPLNHVVLGGELLCTQPDYIISLKSPQQVREVASALPAITAAEFRRRYFAINEDSYGFPKSQEDFEYTWERFQGVRDLFLRAAQDGRFVLFTADQ